MKPCTLAPAPTQTTPQKQWSNAHNAAFICRTPKLSVAPALSPSAARITARSTTDSRRGVSPFNDPALAAPCLDDVNSRLIPA
jgi:hypothetical protein